MGLKSNHFFLLCFVLASSLTCAQKSSPQKQVEVLVLNAHLDPTQPVQSAKVSLDYTDGSTRITDARDVTNPKGEAWLLVSPDLTQRSDLRLEISGLSNLVIYEPADGQLPALPAAVTLKLLPKGSPALSNPAQLEAMVNRLSQSVTKLKAQSAQQQKQLNGLQSQLAQSQAEAQKQDLNAALEDWAQHNGLALTDVQKKLQEWAQSLQSDPAASAERKALAAFALKNYAQAADLFAQANDDETAAFEAQKKLQQQQNLAALSKILATTKQRANALQLASHYHDATAALTKTRDYLATQHNAFPDDPGIYNLWLSASMATADIRRAEGEIASAENSIKLLDQSIADYQTLIADYDKTEDSNGKIAAQIGLGHLFLREAERVKGAQVSALFAQAVQAFQAELDFYPKADHPRDWAKAQLDLGTVFAEEGERASGQKSIALLAQAAQAFRSALELLTKEDSPKLWTTTQIGLAVVLMDQGERVSGEKSIALLDQAVQTFNRALEVDTKADTPQEWAIVKTDLGIALEDEAVRLSGQDSIALLDQAVHSYRSALEVYTKADLPQDWAWTQRNLALTLSNESAFVTGQKSFDLSEQAVQAFNNALQVFTKADLPQDWAKTQMGLGSALSDEGMRATGEKSMALLDQSVEAFQNALQLLSKEHLPQDWAAAQMNLGVALENQGEHSTGEKSIAFLDHSLLAFQNALQVYTKAALPQQWVNTMLNMTEARLVSGHFDACLSGANEFDEKLLESWQIPALNAMKFACAWGAGNKAVARQMNDSLLNLSRLAQGAYDFTGILAFARQSPAFSSGRESWLHFFNSVQNADLDAMKSSLHQLQPLMQN